MSNGGGTTTNYNGCWIFERSRLTALKEKARRGVDFCPDAHIQLAIVSKGGERKASHDTIIKEGLESGLRDVHASSRPARA